MEKLRRVLRLLIEEEPLPTRLREHPLKGDCTGCRDLHIEPDWLLLYSRTIVAGTSVSVHRIVG